MVEAVLANRPHSLQSARACSTAVRSRVHRRSGTDRGDPPSLHNRRDVLGALSPEAHETLAIAMNRIGGKSNSGEGGEICALQASRGRRLGKQRDQANCQRAVRVTAAYLASAKEIEIKMAQGAKPGEGGQLPGHKVSAYIASLRHAVPGVT